ncbi:MAG: phosphomethylpyrimidine synthase ThiC [Syntrophomonas sp.]
MEHSYKTQKEAARRGFITGEMKRAAERENIEAAVLAEGIAEGSIVLPANQGHKSLDPWAIGKGLRTKINVNLGVSGACLDWQREWLKARTAWSMQAEAIMDLSCGEAAGDFRRKLTAESPAMIGTVPVYELADTCASWLDLKAGDFLEVVESQAKDGVDFMTIHAGLIRAVAERLKNRERLTNIVSRGGSLLFAWMAANGKENPFYEHFDELLEICRAYDVTLSLGDACRPGSIHDASDACQIEELIILGELTLRAWERDVQVMIEGPGHMPVQEIAANMILQKKLCHGAPFYVLGPLVTDVAPGYDHITSAIGGAIAAASGADFLCYVTPAEHLRLPTLDDMREGIIAARIAAHAGDLAKGVQGAYTWDYDMSRARKNLDWEAMFTLAIDPEKARRYREESSPPDQETCTMCGDLCAVKNMREWMDKQVL